MSYWDSSALLKLYTKESDSSIFQNRVNASATLPVTARLAIYEMQTALRRKEREGALRVGAALTIHQKLLQDVNDGHIRIIEFTPQLENKFGEILEQCFNITPPLLIRTLDAIHLAAAFTASESEMIVTDKRLRDIAFALGLKAFP